MNKVRKQRMAALMVIVFGVGMAVSLALYALSKNINLYLTPSQMRTAHLKSGQIFRLGGMVKQGSVRRTPNSLLVSFVLTDYKQQVRVDYIGVLPTLFRAGQGIVTQGRLNHDGVFIADQVLAKHDQYYEPPGFKPKQPARGSKS